MLDKDGSPAESNDSESEEAQVDRDLAMKEKEQVKEPCEGFDSSQTDLKATFAEFGF